VYPSSRGLRPFLRAIAKPLLQAKVCSESYKVGISGAGGRPPGPPWSGFGIEGIAEGRRVLYPSCGRSNRLGNGEKMGCNGCGGSGSSGSKSIKILSKNITKLKFTSPYLAKNRWAFGALSGSNIILV
jgi:hypothetical protein